MSRSFLSLLLAFLLLSAASAQATYRNNVQLLFPPTTIYINGSVSITIQYETSYVGLFNLHFDLSDLNQNYRFGGGAMVQLTGPAAGDYVLTAVINNASLAVGDQYQLHAYITPANYSMAPNGVLGNDWMYAIANTYPVAVVSSTPLINSMTLLYPPTTIPQSGYVLFDVQYSSNLPWYTMLHIDLSDISQKWAYEGGSFINVTSPGTGTVQLNISVQNGGQPLALGDSYDVNMYMTSADINQRFGTGLDWQNRNFSSTATTVSVGPATTFYNNAYLPNPPTQIPTTGTFTVYVAYSTNFSGQVVVHCDLSDINSNPPYAYDGGYSQFVTGPGTGMLTFVLNISAQVSAALNTSHAFQLHTYLLDEATSQATGVYNDWMYAWGTNYYPVRASPGAKSGVFDDYIQLLNAPYSIPNSGILFLTVEYESTAAGTTDLCIDLSDGSQNYAWGGGISKTVASPSAGIVTLQFNLVNGTAGLLNALDVWQFHVYTVSAANATAHSDNVWNYPNAQQYYPVVVSATPITNYAYMVNPPAIIPQTGSITLDIAYTSNLVNQTVIHLDLNDLTQNWKWFYGSSVTVNSPSSGTVRLTLNFPPNSNLTVGDNMVLQYYLTSIYNDTTNPGNDWQTFQFEDRVYVQVAPVGQFANTLTPIKAPAQVPNTGNFSVQYQYSTNVTGLVNLHCDILDVTTKNTYGGGAAVVQVEGPSQGTVVFTVNLATAASLSDQLALHAYATPNSFSLDNGGSANDYMGVAVETYTSVSAVLPGNYKPFVYTDNLMFLNPPTTIPQNGTIDIVMLWTSSAARSTVLHCDLSDITANYAWDGGYTTVVASPGSGSITCSFPLTAVLNPGHSYQFHGYSVSAVNHTVHSANEWQWTNFDVYALVQASGAPQVNIVQLLNPPVTIPQTGTITYELAYTSIFATQTVLHLDLNDETLGWRWYTGSQVTVPSPGSGTVQVTMNFAPSLNLTIGDVFALKAYMTSIVNSTAFPGDDWQHSGYDNYNTVAVAATGSFINAMSPLYAPVAVPTVGPFQAIYQYSTNISGVVDLHLDLSDMSWSYISGSPTMQVAGPSQGTVTFNFNVTQPSGAVKALSVGQSYYLHAYMAAATDGLEYGTGSEWMAGIDRADSIITVPAALPANVATAQLPFSIVFYQNPGVIPQSGTVEWVVEWSSPSPVASNLHIDLSDVSANYSWGGGASVTVPSPGRGFRTLSIPIVGTLNAGDVWQAHAYITTIANATLDPNNDWKHSSVDLYVPVIVSATPLTNYMQMLAPPSTIPTAGTMTLEVFYKTACQTSANLHLDLSDVTQKWLYEAGSWQTVPSPGTGTLTFTITTTAAMNLQVGDTFDLHTYLTCAANVTQADGGMDWMYPSFDSTAVQVQAALPGTFINSLRPVSAPYYIPSSGNFTLQYVWSCNFTGTGNFHVDLSDLSYNWLYKGGATVQATCPGTGVAPFTIGLSNNISTGDSYELHAYIAPADSGLIYGTSTDWQHQVFDGFTVVQATSSNQGVSNSLTFVNPVAIIPQSGSFFVQLAWTSNLAAMSNIHIDLSDVTANWTFEVGSLTQVASPGGGSISVQLTVPASLNLKPGDVFELHAYMASIANATLYGNSTDWQHSAVDAYTVVTVIAGQLYNQMTIINAPSMIANSGQETYQLIWSSPTADLLNLHCDLSDVTQKYAYEGGSYLQVQGPGSGLVYMTVVMANNINGGPLTIGDNYTLHCYMANQTTTNAVGGTGNDWKAPQFEALYPMTVAAASSFVNNMQLLQVPSTVPTSGNLTLQVAWSSNLPGETNLHLDLSDVSTGVSYDGGAMQVVASPGSGIATFNILIVSAMPVKDQYELHAYMAPTANSSSWGGSGNDWSHATFQQVWLVNATGSQSGGGGTTQSTGGVAPKPSSSTAAPTGTNGASGVSNGGGGSGLSGGSIAGIVIGSVVGVSILVAILALFVCSGRSRKGGKMDDDAKQSGSHQRHLDEPSRSAAPSAVEMGETHSMDEGDEQA